MLGLIWPFDWPNVRPTDPPGPLPPRPSWEPDSPLGRIAASMKTHPTAWPGIQHQAVDDFPQLIFRHRSGVTVAKTLYPPVIGSMSFRAPCRYKLYHNDVDPIILEFQPGASLLKSAIDKHINWWEARRIDTLTSFVEVGDDSG